MVMEHILLTKELLTFLILKIIALKLVQSPRAVHLLY